MKTEMEERICPKCGCVYTEVPALSRVDNETLICADCSTKEALESIGTQGLREACFCCHILYNMPLRYSMMFVTFIIANTVDYVPEMR